MDAETEHAGVERATRGTGSAALARNALVGHRRARARLPTHSWWRAALVVGPAVVLFSLFVILPIGYGTLSSFRRFDFTGQATGPLTLENYRTALGDEAFVRSLRLALGFTLVKIPLQLCLGLGAALLFAGSTRFHRVARSAIILPSFVAIAVVGYLFSYLFDTRAGLFNVFLTTAGGPRIAWLQDERWAQAAVLATSVWRDTGSVLLVFVGGLAAIPQSVIEASRLDGATPWQSFRFVVLPLLRRAVQFAVVLTTLLAAQLVVPVLLLTKGGPIGATAIAPYVVYERSFILFDWGPANAMAMIFLGMLLAATLVELYLLRPRWEWS